MKKVYDVAVIGLGAMGGAALYQLAKRGANVIGIDQFDPPHQLGSSGGETRVTREAIGEGKFCTPFAIRSNQIWREIEAQTGEDLLTRCGVLIMTSYSTGSEMHGNSDFLQETVAAADQFGIEHRLLDTDQIRAKFPQFNLIGDERGYYEYGGGFLRPESCIRVQLNLAKRFGAEIKLNTKVEGIQGLRENRMVQTEQGTIWAKKIVISAGAWLSKLYDFNFYNFKPKNLFEVRRQVLYWFDVKEDISKFLIDRFPVFIWVTNDGFIYGFPAIDGLNGGVKVASEEVTAVNPDRVDRTVSTREIEDVYLAEVADRLPDLSPHCVKVKVCLYTVTPDSRFVVDFDPDDPNTIIASLCSGHGFKHSAAIGETLAQLALDGKSQLDISPFSFSRFWE